MSKNKHNNKVCGSQIERSDDRINETGEVFTPNELVERMVEETLHSSKTDWMGEIVTFLENSAGDGNFLVELIETVT